MYLGPKREDVVKGDGEDMGDNLFEDFKLQNHTFYKERNGSKLYFMLEYTNIRFNHSLIEIDLNNPNHYHNGIRPKKDVQMESALMITQKNINTYKEDMVKLFFAYIQNTAQAYYRERNIMYTNAVNVENPADKFKEMDKYSEETKEKVAECKEKYATIQNVVKENELKKIDKKIKANLENYVTGFDFANYEQEMIDIMKNNLTASRDALFECADGFPREIAALKAKADAEVEAELKKAGGGEGGVGGGVPQVGGEGKGGEDGSGGGNGEGDAVGQMPQPGGEGKGGEDGSGGGNGEGDAVGQMPQPGDEGNGADVAGNVDEYSLDRYNIKEGVLPTAGVWVYDRDNDLVGKYNNDTFEHNGKKKTQGNSGYYYYTTKSGKVLYVRNPSLLNVLEAKKTAAEEAKAAADAVGAGGAGGDAADAAGADGVGGEAGDVVGVGRADRDAADAAGAGGAGGANDQAEDAGRPTPRVQDTGAAFDPNLADIEIMPRTPEGFSRCEKMMKEFTDWHNQVDPNPDIYVYEDNVIEEQKKLFLDLSNEIWLIVFKYGPEKKSQDVVGFAQCQRLTQDHFGKTMNLDKLWIVPGYAKPGMGGHFCRASIKKVIQNQKKNPFSKIHAMVIYKNLEALSFFNKKFNMSFNFSKEVIDGVSRLRGGTFGDLDEDDRNLVYKNKTKTSTPDEILELVKTNEDFYKRCFDRISKGVLKDMANGQDFNIAANVSLNGEDLTFEDCWVEDFKNFLDAIRTNNGSIFQPFNLDASSKEVVKNMAEKLFNDNQTSLRRSIADHVLNNKEWRAQDEKNEVKFDDKFIESCKKFKDKTQSQVLKNQMLQVLVSADEGAELPSHRPKRGKK